MLGSAPLEVARGLATGPRPLLLDAVTAGLNPTEIIEHLMRAILALSHHLVALHHGERIVGGAPASVARDPRMGEAYLGEVVAVEGRR